MQRSDRVLLDRLLDERGDRISIELVKRHEAEVIYARLQLTKPAYVLIYDRRVILKD